MKCQTHIEADAVSVCSICGKRMCKECQLKLVGRFYCQECADNLMKDGAIIALKKLYEILEEKRKHHRIYTLLPVELYLTGREGMFIKGIIHNMSTGGVAILCDKDIPLNEVVVLYFKLPNGIVLEDVQGGVVRVEKIGDKYNLGVLFMNLLEKQQIVDDFILDIKKKKYASDSADITKYVL